MEQYTLEMHMVGNNLFVYINFWDRNIQDYRKGLLTFDTGASVTTISKDILFDLGYDVVSGKTQKITTASGVEYVKEVIIDKIRFGGYELKDLMVYAHTFPEESFTTGVLGLNALSQFDISLLFSKKMIELVKIGGN